MNQTDTDKGAVDLPPCPRCGQPMPEYDPKEYPEEYQCKPCRIDFGPLSMMRGENKGKLLLSITEMNYSMEETFTHIRELKEWLKPRVGIEDEPGVPVVAPVVVIPAMANSDLPVPRSAQPQSPEIRAWKHAHALMWQRWREFIDFETLKRRHLAMPEEWRLDALFDAIGMLYGEYLTDHINEYRELEAQLLEKYKVS